MTCPERDRTMKKRDKKLSLHRETVLRLDSGDLRNAIGGTGIDTSCGEPNCCDDGTTIGRIQQLER